ncbi:vWA domain-containing protein [Natribacillus halophilus]|uniref:Ca-activated chloride channel family protein n=1 Tax=Natribacillus halophilus TaxID=549003 RepID=A0A1G8QBA0_9BACI|nr:VWA domain-containing protein [Natribacillus halophilus]SDJ01833.1 Ca-activated chloride channel family protein [Natribacillus halophilus]
MGKLTHVVIVSLMALILVTYGCSDDEATEQEENGDIEDESTTEQDPQDPNEWLDEQVADVDAPPEDLDEILEQEPGPLAGQRMDDHEEEFMEVLEPLMQFEADEWEETEETYEQLWTLIHSWVANDFPDPNNIVQQIRQTQIGHPDFEDEGQFSFEDQFNAQIILDASGSMGEEIEGTSKMEIAKDSIESFVETLPEDAQIGLRVYGHEGDNTNEGREESCESSELVYDIQEYDEDAFADELGDVEPTGWTPISYSLQEAEQDFENYPGEENTNIIYLVSDGIETCDGDPVEAAEQLSSSEVQPFLNIIGFDIDPEGQEELRELADMTEGTYTNAANEDELTQQLEQSEELSERWEDWLSGAQSEAHSDRFQISMGDIPAYRSEWREGYRVQESAVRLDIANFLEDEDVITDDARQYIRSEADDLQSMKSDIADEIRDDLDDINDENYEEMVEDIEELQDEYVND